MNFREEQRRRDARVFAAQLAAARLLCASFELRLRFTMSKRAADASEEQSAALKAGERPVSEAPPDEVGEFEDEYEDEFESEEEIFEAGVDGRPDEEREAEEQEGTWQS